MSCHHCSYSPRWTEKETETWILQLEEMIHRRSTEAIQEHWDQVPLHMKPFINQVLREIVKEIENE